jgi:hypothetical protein
MHRRLILAGILALTLGACGGSSATPSPTISSEVSLAPSVAPVSAPPESLQPSLAPASEAPVAGSTSTAICDGISIRKSSTTSSTRLGSINSGTAVHIVATETGQSYTAGACGTSGDTWLKIDRVGGKDAKSVYGVTDVYAAAGFFQ